MKVLAHVMLPPGGYSKLCKRDSLILGAFVVAADLQREAHTRLIFPMLWWKL